MHGPLASLLWRSLRVHQVFGANTDVGKTIFTTLLCRTAIQRRKDNKVTFLKPVSTGSAEDADDHHIRQFTKGVTYETLVQYHEAVSPHLAAIASGQPILSDQDLVAKCRSFAATCATKGEGWLFVETAGGVHSPTPSGSTQANAYIPLRVPVVLIGDSRLGGVSQTISAFEALHIRGYAVESVLLFQDAVYRNYQYLSEYFHQHHGISVTALSSPPERNDNVALDEQAMSEYYANPESIDKADQVLESLDRRHQERIDSVESLPQRAHQHIWYPFTQQKLVQVKDITAIDSAHGDFFQTLTRPTASPAPLADPVLCSSFDGSASWWTQGLGHSNPRLTLAAAHAAGRYGHVMFASAVHEPAMSLAQALLKGMQNPRLNRVFFSDNGSTGTEVAVKMGLRAARVRYGWGPEDKIGVLGLKGGYHGDTIGAMDMAEPCPYNEKIEWYEGKGYWFDYPTVLCSGGQWTVKVNDSLATHVGSGQAYASLNDIFDVDSREQRNEHAQYEEYILKKLAELKEQGRKFGSLIIEPIVLGAGGMELVDPLFQRALVNVVRRSAHLFGHPDSAQPVDDRDWSGLPVIFDEVFTGLYRLGRFTPSSFLNVNPDISVHAKLLTGGLVPLSTTLASEHIFNIFGSEDKTDALLHGHSYTAHPIGCAVALQSLKEMQATDQRGDWDWARSNGWRGEQKCHTVIGARNDGSVWSMWPLDFVNELSRNAARVDGVWALGNVLAIHLKDAAGAGYNSNAAQGLREALSVAQDAEDEGPWNVHSRVLGNVLYLMTSQVTTEATVQRIAALLRKTL